MFTRNEIIYRSFHENRLNFKNICFVESSTAKKKEKQNFLQFFNLKVYKIIFFFVNKNEIKIESNSGNC